MTNLTCGLDGSSNQELIEAVNNNMIHISYVDTMEDLLSVDINKNVSVNVKGYWIANNGGGGIFNYDSTIDKSTADGGRIIDPGQSLANQGDGIGNGCWIRQNDIIINSQDFGVIADGINDDTLSFQESLSFASSIGGGIVTLPPGVVIISMAASTHSNACILIPKNIHLKGAGKDLTTITRPSAERGVNGVLIVNKNYDTIPDYGADGNIIIEHLKITDGATTPNRSLGDLIGFGNGDGLLVQYCDFGNHDQHAIDIAKSKNVIVRWNDSENQVAQSASATYQIDAGLIWGIISGTEKDSINIKVYENNIKDSRADNIIHFHSANFSKNVYIYKNTINATNLGVGQNAIGGDSDTSYRDVHIYKNIITLNNIGSRGINFFVQDNSTVEVDELRIYENEIKGIFKTAIFVGDDSPSLLNYNGPLKSAYIYNNIITVDLTTPASSIIRLLVLAGFKTGEIDNNKISLLINGQTQETRLIEDNNNQFAVIKDNKIYQLDDGLSVPTVYYPIVSYSSFAVTNSLSKHFDISDNYIDVENSNYHIITADAGIVDTYNLFTGSISRNEMIGSPSISNIFETFPLTDGTNNQRYVDFTGLGALATDPYILPVASATAYNNLPLSGTKKAKTADSRVGKTKVDIIYSPNVATGFSNDSETVSNIYISGTQCAGMIIKDIDNINGIFDLVTGSDGVSMVINDTTFQPVLRTGGWIKILTGI